MAIHSKFLKTLRQLVPSLAVTVPLTAVAVANPESKVHWAKSPDGVRVAYEVHGQGSLALICPWLVVQSKLLGRSDRTVLKTVRGCRCRSGRPWRLWPQPPKMDDPIVWRGCRRRGEETEPQEGHSHRSLHGGRCDPGSSTATPRPRRGPHLVGHLQEAGERSNARRSPGICCEIKPKFPRSNSRPRSKHVRKPRGTSRARHVFRAPSIALPSVDAAFSYSREMPRTLEQLHLPVIAINPDNAPTDVASLEHYGVQVIIMPGVGHFLMMEDPQRFNGLLSTAIGRLNRE